MHRWSILLLSLPAFAASSLHAETGSSLSEGQQAFLQLAQNEDPIELEVHLDRRDQRYAVGDPVTISVVPAEDAYLNVFSIDAQGKATLLYPNDHAAAALAPAGRRREFPDTNEPWGIVTDRPGTELIKVIASKSPRPLAAKAAFEPAGPFRVYRATGSEFVRQLRGDGEPALTDRWGHASLVMTVGGTSDGIEPPPPMSDSELKPRTGPLDGLAKNLPRRPKLEPSLY